MNGFLIVVAIFKALHGIPNMMAHNVYHCCTLLVVQLPCKWIKLAIKILNVIRPDKRRYECVPSYSTSSHSIGWKRTCRFRCKWNDFHEIFMRFSWDFLIVCNILKMLSFLWIVYGWQSTWLVHLVQRVHELLYAAYLISYSFRLS